MGEEATVLENHIQHERRRLAESMNEIEARVSRATDWRYQYAKNPMALLGGAFVVGFLIAGLGSSNGDSGSFKSRFKSNSDSDGGANGSKMATMMNGLQAAVVGALTHEVKDYLRHRFGYRQDTGPHEQNRDV